MLEIRVEKTLECIQVYLTARTETRGFSFIRHGTLFIFGFCSKAEVKSFVSQDYFLLQFQASSGLAAPPSQTASQPTAVFQIKSIFCWYIILRGYYCFATLFFICNILTIVTIVVVVVNVANNISVYTTMPLRNQKKSPELLELKLQSIASLVINVRFFVCCCCCCFCYYCFLFPLRRGRYHSMSPYIFFFFCIEICFFIFLYFCSTARYL